MLPANPGRDDFTQAQYALSHGVLYSRNVLLAERCRFAKPHTFSLGTERHSRRSAAEVADEYRDGCFKHPIDNGAVEMHAGIKRGAEPVDEGQCLMSKIVLQVFCGLQGRYW